MKLSNFFTRINQNLGQIFRSIALHVNALLPFITSLKNYLNGKILRGMFAYIRDYIKYSAHEKTNKSGFRIKFLNCYPILTERYDAAGGLPRHYFWQDLWAARKVFDSRVQLHYDIGSRLDGFIAHCLPFCEVVMLDIRPLSIPISGLSFIQADCISMPHIESSTINSLSSLHAIEHFGLGRYGDPIDPLGHESAIKELQRVLVSGGDIYFSAPIGNQRLEFNARRIFNPMTIVKLFECCSLVEFSVVDDEDLFHENVNPQLFTGLLYGCGLFHFRKQEEKINQVHIA